MSSDSGLTYPQDGDVIIPNTIDNSIPIVTYSVAKNLLFSFPLTDLITTKPHMISDLTTVKGYTCHVECGLGLHQDFVAKITPENMSITVINPDYIGMACRFLIFF